MIYLTEADFAGFSVIELNFSTERWLIKLVFIALGMGFIELALIKQPVLSFLCPL
jgi:hypothetical protein